jgi:hypothetical protein
LQYMTSHTLKIRELNEELFDNLDPSHCRKSKTLFSAQFYERTY